MPWGAPAFMYVRTYLYIGWALVYRAAACTGILCRRTAQRACTVRTCCFDDAKIAFFFGLLTTEVCHFYGRKEKVDYYQKKCGKVWRVPENVVPLHSQSRNEMHDILVVYVFDWDMV